MSFESFQAVYGRWRAMLPAQVGKLFAGCGFPWWIGGGWAVEAAGGRQRAHEDTDVVVLRRDLAEVRRQLGDYHLWQARDGFIKPLARADAIGEEISQLWLRRNASSPWELDLLLTPTDGDDWLYRRENSVRRPVGSIGFLGVDGLPYLRPEIVLLFKAKLHRGKDQADFDALLPQLSAEAREFLAASLHTTLPEHPWLVQLRR
ncbi:MAG: amino acid transporter [Candidatus Dormibacteraeota bacterium]|uniref:Amino acid transporter n=1 Tax=Candidatus Amunia macphersoniae TaxID=3127014 RepID=A0A934N999_9BACT|nr:amino acid transporter [Candidatus Dormibacteraeota bacterium]